MKSNLEQSFKNAFEEYEMSYNPQSWDALSNKLDKIQIGKPTGSSSMSSKVVGGIIAAAVITTIGIIYFQNSETPSEGKIASTYEKSSDSKLESKTSDKTVTPFNSDKATDHSVNNSSNLTVQKDESTSLLTNNTTAENNKTTNSQEQKKQNSITTSSTEVAQQKNSAINSSGNLSSDHKRSDIVVNLPTVKIPMIQKVVCEKSTITIPNSNSVELEVTAPSGKITKLQPSKNSDYKTYEAGTYYIGSKYTTDISSFVVKENPRVDFTMNDEIKYENGIPSIPMESNSDATNFEWNFENIAQKQYGAKANAHFYKKGTYEVTLKARKSFGCETNVSKNITIDEDYNLLAPSGFIPQSNDIRKSRFIPYALTVRNTDFKLFIIEPKTGNTIFETTSIEGWDGIDKTTGQMVEENKPYVWKVILATPEPGERNEYSGVVVRL